MKKTKVERDTEAFTNGAYIEAVEVKINGRRQWRWIVTGFEDDSYQDGERVDINTSADTLDGLFFEGCANCGAQTEELFNRIYDSGEIEKYCKECAKEEGIIEDA